MNQENDGPVTSSEEKVHELVAEFHRREDQGNPISSADFMAQHSEHAEALRSYFQSVAAVDAMSDPAPLEQTFIPNDTQAVGNDQTVIEVSTSAASTKLTSDAPPTKFGRYRILQELGRGAMGAVYLAQDEQLDRKVALKIPQFGGAMSAGLLERFYREARAAGNLRHPGICPVYDVGEIDGQHYITMAYIEGRPLRDFTKSSKRQPGKQVARVIRKIAMAMAEAHEHNVVHRDLKPANVMIDKKNEPVVMDFGLARRATEGEERLTHTGTVIGTPAYMSPEQVDGDNENVGPQSDIYSLGVIFYELLAGELPFQGNLMSILKQIALKEPRPPIELHSDIDATLQNLCLKMLAKEAKDRPESMEQVAKELSDWLQGRHAPTDESGVLETSRVPGQKRKKNQAVEATDPMTVPGLARSEPIAEEFPSAVDMSVTTQHPRTSMLRGGPPKQQKRLLFGALGGAAILLAGIIFFVRVGKYDVQITLDDPTITLSVDGETLNINNDGEVIKLSAGEHKLQLEKDGLKTHVEEFTVTKDGKTALTAVVVNGKLDGLLNNEKPKREISPKIADMKPGVSSSPVATGPASAPSPAITPLDEGGAYPGKSALSFPERKESYVEVPGLASKLMGELLRDKKLDLTIEFWLKRDRQKISPHDHYAGWSDSYLFVRSAAGGAYVEGGEWGGRGAPPVQFYNATAPTRTLKNEAVWTHVAAVLINPTENRLFIDGKLVDKKAAEWGWAGSVDPFQLMAQASGMMGETRVSTVARYDQGFTPEFNFKTDKDTLALYHFDEGSGDVLKDSSGNGHHGKIVGAKWVNVAALPPASSGTELPAGKFTPGATGSASAPPPAIAPFDATQANALSPSEILTSPEWTWSEPVPLPESVNSDAIERSPSLSIDGNILLFTRVAKDKGPSDAELLMSRRSSDGEWSVAQPLNGDIRNLRGLDEPELQTATGNLFLHTSNLPGRVGASDLFVSRHDDAASSWSVPESLGRGINSTGHDQSPTVSADGRVLVFHSDRDGGQGNMDLWISTRQSVDAEWKVPVNVGNAVNSADFETHPCMSSDGLVLMFVRRESATNSHRSLWQSVRQDRNSAWAPPKKVSYVSTYHERDIRSPALSADGKTLLFASGTGDEISIDLMISHRVRSGSRGATGSGVAPPLAVAPFDAATAKQHQEAWAKHLGTTVETTNSLGQKMILIPPGEFLIGSSDADIEQITAIVKERGGDNKQWVPRQATEAETPQHRVTLTKPFLLAATEVTVAQFRRFVEETRYQSDAERYGSGNSALTRFDDRVNPQDKGIDWLNPGYEIADDQPVSQVSPKDALAYCDWLSKKENAVYGLPTEAEWEFACRAGTATPYYFGTDDSKYATYAWCYANVRGRPQPVATKKPNPFGLFDMQGNITEYCSDMYDSAAYAARPASVVDPIRTGQGNTHAQRGKSWMSFPFELRSASRYGSEQTSRYMATGFRVARRWNTTPPPAVAPPVVALFDARTFAGWQSPDGSAVPADWTIEGDAIVAPGSKSSIATVAEFGDFELELEWKVSAGANGGVFYGWHGKTIPSTTDGLLVVAPEFQIVDNIGHPNGRKAETSAGSIFGLYAPSKDATKPVGEWNQARIVVRGADVEHWLNGVQVVACSRGSEDWKQQVAKLPRFGNEPEFSQVGPGRIVLQGYSGKVWYRQIRLRPIATITPQPVASSGKLFMHDPAFQAWMKDVQAMPAEKQVEAVAKKLVELNPGFDGAVRHNLFGGSPRIENGVVTEFGLLTDNVTDISPVRAFTGLNQLFCGVDFVREPDKPHRGALTDLSPLKGMSLTTFLSAGNVRLTDLSPLKGMPLTQLGSINSMITDLSPLQGMPLKDLGLNGSFRLTDLSPLEGLPLTTFSCGNAKVTDLSPLKDMQLTKFTCYATSVTDLSPLQGMPLTWLDCSGSKVTDLTPLKGMPLTYLDSSYTKIMDLSPLLDGPSLTTLKIKETAVTAAEVAGLQKALPNCKIIWDDPGTAQQLLPSPLDNLDPAAIPAEERFEWQPQELVAVIGSHARRHWESPVAAAISPDGKLAATLAMSRGTFATDNLIVWDLATQTVKWRLGMQCYDQGYLWFTPDSQRLVVMPRHEHLHVFTLNGPEPDVQRLNLPGITNPETHHRGAILEQGRTLAIPLQGSNQFTLHTADWERSEISKTVSTSPQAQTKTRFLFANDANQAVYVSMEGKLRRATIRNAQWEQDEELSIPLADGEELSAVAPDGKRLTIQTATEFQIWDIAGDTPQKHGSVAAPSNYSSQFSPDGRWLTIKYTGAVLYRIDGAEPKRIAAVSSEGQGGAFARIAFSADGNQAVCTNGANFVRFWNLSGAEPVEQSAWDLNTAFSTRYWRPTLHPDDGRLLLSRFDRASRYSPRYQRWNLSGRTPVPSPNAQTFVDINREAGRILPAGPDTYVALTWWPDMPGAELYRFDGKAWKPSGSPFGLTNAIGETSHDGRSLVVMEAGRPSELSGWNLTTNPPTQKWKLPIGPRESGGGYNSTHQGRCLTIADNQQVLAAYVPAEAGKDPTQHELLLIHHLDSQPKIVAKIPVSMAGRDLGAYAFALSRDGRFLAHTRDHQNELILEDISGPQPRQLQSTKIRLGGIFHWLSFSPDGRHLACATDENVIVLEVATFKTVWKWDAPGDVEWLDWADDGRHLVTLNSNHTVYVLRLNQLAPAVPDVVPPEPAMPLDDVRN